MEDDEDRDGDTGADPQSDQGGTEKVVDHAFAQGEERWVSRDGAEGDGFGASVRVSYLLGPVGAHAGCDEGFGEGEHADGVPLVGGGGAGGLPGGGACGGDEGGGEDHAEELPPGAQASGGGADATPVIASGPGRGALAACSSVSGTGPASAAAFRIWAASSRSPEFSEAGIGSCSLASQSLPARSGRMGRR